MLPEAIDNDRCSPVSLLPNCHDLQCALTRCVRSATAARRVGEMSMTNREPLLVRRTDVADGTSSTGLGSANIAMSVTETAR